MKKASFSLFYLIFIALTILVSISLSGCLTPRPTRERWVNAIDMEMDLKPAEVESINYSDAQNRLEKINFTMENNSGKAPGYHYRSYNIHYRYSSLFIVIAAYNESTNPTANLHLLYSTSIPDDEIENEKIRLQKLTDQVAGACNITLDWSKATWTFSYQD